MTRFDTAIARAETDLGHVQSALDSAHQVLGVADKAHSVGRRAAKMVRVVAMMFAFGAVVIGLVVLFERLWRGFQGEGVEETTHATDSSPVDDQRVESASRTEPAGSDSPSSGDD